LHVADLDAVEDHLAADAEARHRILEDNGQMRIGVLAGAAREPVDEYEAEREHDKREGADQGCVGLCFHTLTRTLPKRGASAPAAEIALHPRMIEAPHIVQITLNENALFAYY